MKEFDKIIGYDSIKKELERICDVVKYPEKYAALGVNVPKGLLLDGMPGVGKTLMANCFVKATGRKVYTCRKDKESKDFIADVKALFEEAAQNAPSIIFLDDIDKFANNDSDHKNAEEFITVQSCIDDLSFSYEDVFGDDGIMDTTFDDETSPLDEIIDAGVSKNVFVIATANDLRCLPSSLLRAGRFDKRITVYPPSGEDAIKIVEHYLKNKKVSSDIDTRLIAKILEGRSCATLESLVNEAGIYAGYANKDCVEMEDMVEAAMYVIFGSPTSLDDRSDEENLAVAYHEAGHALISEYYKPQSVTIVSIRLHDESATEGVTDMETENNHIYYKSDYMKHVQITLAGRAATEIVFGEVDLGVSSDYQNACQIIEEIIMREASEGFLYTTADHYDLSPAEKQQKTIIITQILRENYEKVRKILVKNRILLNKIAILLKERKTLLQSDISKLIEEVGVVKVD